MGYFLYESVKDKRYFESAATLYTGFSRFYVGNIMSARELARDYNESHKEIFVENAKREYGSDLE
jgi:hypothetical protein